MKLSAFANVLLTEAIHVHLSHLQVRDPHFLALHAFYQKVYEFMQDEYDSYAERALTCDQNLELLKVEAPPDAGGGDMRREVQASLDACIAACEDAYPEADRVTKAMIDETQRTLEKFCWMLEALS